MLDVMFRKLTLMLLFPALTACLAQTDIQANYMRAQSGCRDNAETQISNYPAGVAEEQQSMALAKAFSDCMVQQGWHVSTPKGTTAVAQNPPTGSPSTNPSAATAVAAPPSGAPSVAPSAAAARVPQSPPVAPVAAPAPAPVPSGAATYQPARPDTVSQPGYGAGAGRQF